MEDRGQGPVPEQLHPFCHEDAVRLRDLRAGVVARVLKPVGQPEGASWSGRTRPDKEHKKSQFDSERAGAMDVSFEDRRYEEKLK